VKNKDSDIFHDLITHSGFRDWVQNPNEDNSYFWRKWIKEHPENVSDLQKAREFIERMHFRREELSTNELDDLLGKVIANEASSSHSLIKKPKSSGWSFFDQWFKVAAILIFSLVAAVVLKGLVKEVQEKPMEAKAEWITLKNPKGRKSKVTLSDGTQVNLNYESQLKFPKVFEGNIRKVELIGEAFFEVVKNDTMPFVVQAGDLETEVLGTSFNIRAYGREQNAEVSLVTGKVKINYVNEPANKGITHLSPGEQLRYDSNSGQTVKSTFDLEEVIAWKEGIILFKDAGFEEFIDQLERWYGVDFQIYGTPSKKWKVNGRYENQKLDDILMGLNFVYGLEYKIQGKNVILKFK
jgi:transmembrane sensor